MVMTTTVILFLVLLSGGSVYALDANFPIKVCANCLTDGLSHLLRATNSINPALGISLPQHYSGSAIKNSTSIHDLEKRASKGRKLIDMQQRRKTYFLESSLHKVRIAPDSPQGIAQATNLKYMLSLDVDNLVYSFRNNSGLPLKGSPYGGWEAPDKELRGHFVGHYLSATSMMWASTHNEEIHKKMTAVVDALDECQQKTGNGYLSAFPEEFFDRFEAIQYVWAPYYTIHKIMAGLLDQYNYAFNEKALRMVTWMAQYFINRLETYVKKYTIEAHYQAMNEEVGGMNDVMYNLYKISGNPKHLWMAHLFDKPCFLGLLAIQEDSISGFHVNTHLPIVVGAQSRYEVTGSEMYKDLSAYLMSAVTSSHLYATGGTSVNEFWIDPNRIGNALDPNSEETCSTYNMLKIARNLFRYTRDVNYADYYEHTLTNGILTIQNGQEPGVMLYMLPLAPGNSKNSSVQKWGTPYDSFWCCYGTGLESFSKLGDSIYFEGQALPDPTSGMPDDTNELYIIQFVSSNITWDSAGLILQQIVQPITTDAEKLRVQIKFSKMDGNEMGDTVSAVDTMTAAPVALSLNVRIPSWTSDGYKATLNGDEQDISPGSFLNMKRVWSENDNLFLEFPANIRLERIQDDREEYAKMNAILYGPYVLAGMTYGDIEMGQVNISAPSDWMRPLKQSENVDLFSFFQNSSSATLGHVNGSVIIDNQPLDEGLDWNYEATFKLVAIEESNSSVVSMELMQQPGKFITHNGIDQELSIGDADSSSRTFRIVKGLSTSSNNSVSIEAVDIPGCYMYANGLGESVQLKCKPWKDDDTFNNAVTFESTKGVAQYPSISFIAHTPNRSYLFFPHNIYRSEHYSVYFDMS